MPEHDPAPTNHDAFDRIIGNRVEIAEFVNSFDSERVQRKAFDALVWSLGLSGEADEQSSVEPIRLVREVPVEVPDQEQPIDTGQPSGVEGTGNSTRKKRSRSAAKKTYTVPRTLISRREGPAVTEQVREEKKLGPARQPESWVSATTQQHDGIEEHVEIGHILAVFDAAEWSAPTYPDSAVRGLLPFMAGSTRPTASRSRWSGRAKTT